MNPGSCMHKLCVEFLAETFLQLNSSGLSLQVLIKSLKYYYTAHGGGPPLKLSRFHHHHHRPREKKEEKLKIMRTKLLPNHFLLHDSTFHCNAKELWALIKHCKNIAFCYTEREHSEGKRLMKIPMSRAIDINMHKYPAF